MYPHLFASATGPCGGHTGGTCIGSSMQAKEAFKVKGKVLFVKTDFKVSRLAILYTDTIYIMDFISVQHDIHKIVL